MAMTLEPTRRDRRRRRRPISIVGILGEIFITAGAVVLLFLGWQLFINDKVVASAQQTEAHELAQSWDRGEGTAAPAPADRPDPGDPPVPAEPGNAEQFATMMIPRFGADYIRPVSEGIGVEDVLNKHGIGHYPGTAMPGAVGNSAYAAHRTGWGASFFDIDKLQIGDSIYMETQDGWYRYVVRSLEFVPATGVGVIEPVPQSPGAAPTDRLLTLTSCNPIYTADERFIVYSVYDTWYPRAGGPPAEIAALVAQGAG